MEVILAYCLFIIIGALPLIIAFCVMTMPFGALVLWYFSLKLRSFTMFIAGVILISTAAVVIFYSARYLTAQDLDDQDVTKRIESPVLAELKWKRPIPRIFVSGSWDQITPQRMVRAGIVDLVLKQETRRAAGGITEQWKSATVKRNDSCLSALKSDDFQTMSAQKCIELDISKETLRRWISKSPFVRQVKQIDGKNMTLLREGEPGPITHRHIANIMANIFRKKLDKPVTRKEVRLPDRAGRDLARWRAGRNFQDSAG